MRREASKHGVIRDSNPEYYTPGSPGHQSSGLVPTSTTQWKAESSNHPGQHFKNRSDMYQQKVNGGSGIKPYNSNGRDEFKI